MTCPPDCTSDHYGTIAYTPDAVKVERPLHIVRNDDREPKAPVPVEIFQKEDMEAARRLAKNMDNDTAKRLEIILSRLSNANRWRPRVAAVSPSAVLAMKQTFPNFAEVIDEIAAHLVLARLGGAEQSVLALPPLLLVGPPGVGKSYFARQLAEVLGTRFWETSLSTNTSGFMLSGLDMGWSTGKPGLVFNALLESREANPFILLDEIDKANNESKSDPLGALYSLLEPDMAKRFRDEAVTLPIDASHIIWVATANEACSIPEPLLSRMTVFEIPQPNAEQSANIARGIWKQLRETQPWGRFMHSTLEPEVLTRLQGESPRVMGKLLARGAGQAILRKRQKLAAEDIKNGYSTARRIGF